MARRAREKSETGFYHVMIRGIGKQIIFEEDSDYRRFLSTLKRYLDEHDVRIYAYCLMENHVHMLVRDPQDELDVFMKRLEGSYAFYYNHKYERVGTLFQERFKSEPIKDEAYLSVVLRYILQNPQKAGISSTEAYPWSSYSEMFSHSDIIHDDFKELFGRKKMLLKYIHETNDDICMEPISASISDTRAKEIICDRLKIKSSTQLQNYDKASRNAALRVLKESGLSVRQIERLTGINRGVIQNA